MSASTYQHCPLFVFVSRFRAPLFTFSYFLYFFLPFLALLCFVAFALLTLICLSLVVVAVFFLNWWVDEPDHCGAHNMSATPQYCCCCSYCNLVWLTLVDSQWTLSWDFWRQNNERRSRKLVKIKAVLGMWRMFFLHFSMINNQLQKN